MSSSTKKEELAGFRLRLNEPRPLASIFCLVPCLEVVEMIALAGFEAVILDMEHGPIDITALRTLIIAARARGIFAIARVRANDPSLISSVLDAGADAVLVPQIASTAEARRAVAAARFAPEGSRGANPYVRAAGFDGSADWYREANTSAAVLVMIEGAAGAAAAEDIMKVEGLDAVFLGPVDFSHAMGVPGQLDHPMVVEKFESIIELGARVGVATSVFSPSVERGRKWFDRGARMVAFGCDSMHIVQSLSKVAKSALA